MTQTILQTALQALKATLIVAGTGLILNYLWGLTVDLGININRTILFSIWIIAGVIYIVKSTIAKATEPSIVARVQNGTPKISPTPSIIKVSVTNGFIAIGVALIAAFIVVGVERSQDASDMAGMGGAIVMALAPFFGLLVGIVSFIVGTIKVRHDHNLNQ